MSVRYSQSAGDGQPAEDDRRSFTTGIGSMVAPTADDETAAPTRPTFTAKPPSEPPDATVPEPAPAPDYADEAERTVPAEAAPGPGDAAEAAFGPDDDALAEPDAVPEPSFAAEPSFVPAADLAAEDEARLRPQPLAATAGLDEPLLSDVTGLRARWQRAQAGFVDDPQEAVGDAADLIEQTAQAMVGALRQRQRQLRVMWEGGLAGNSAQADPESAARGSDTEHLRQMMMHYRALFNQLCRP